MNISKQKKNPWRYHHFTQVYQKSWSYAKCSWDMVHDWCNFYFSFWAIFWIFIPLTTWKIKNFKKSKKLLEISSFYTCVPRIMITWCTVPEIWCATGRRTDGLMDGRMNGWKKWHIEWVPHLKISKEIAIAQITY